MNHRSSARLLLLVASVAIGVAGVLILASASRAGMLGDVAPVNRDGSGNITGYGDGRVGVDDLMRVLRAWWGTEPLAPEQLAVADVVPVGGDGAITSADVLLYVRAVILGQDVDGDGLANEADTSTSPLSADTDGDGLCDGPLNSAAAQAGRCSGGEDLNGDGLVQANETNPAAADTDGDGLCDGPLNSAAAQAGLCSGGEDLNGNGQVDVAETSPAFADTDGDGLCDGPRNSAAASNGLCIGGEDLNANGIVDSNETNPLSADSDGDGLCDGPYKWVIDPANPSQGSVCVGAEDLNGNGVVDPGETDPLNMYTNGTPDAQPYTQQVSCPDCFALFIMPDIQHYSSQQSGVAVHGANHLATVARYICDHKASWREPLTGKVMPIVAVAQLGDIVDNGTQAAQWQNASAGFDVLDACGVPYMVVPGNHDYPTTTYAATMSLYNQYFAAPCMPGSTACDPGIPPRIGWAPPHFCTNPPSCSLPTEDFLGSGDDIQAHSRDVGQATEGPPTAEPGRHRVILVPTPNGSQLLVIGLDMSFDFGLNDAVHGDDLAWVESLMNTYPNTPTILVHHWLFNNGAGGFSSGTWGSDSKDPNLDWGHQVWNELVVPHPEVVMTLNGHFITGQAANTADEVIGTAPNDRHVYRIFRNFQEVYEKNAIGARITEGGSGWNVIAVFDPSAGEVRMRSYRIDDMDFYRTEALYRQGRVSSSQIDTSHDGTDPGSTGPGDNLPQTLLLDTDYACTNGSQPDCPATLPWNLP